MIAVINYDTKTLKINFNGLSESLDLNKGDVGDFWYALGQKNDVNFYQESEDSEPIVTIYEVVNGEVDTSKYTTAHVMTFGNPNNYFKSK
jgi:hypothetical protein